MSIYKQKHSMPTSLAAQYKGAQQGVASARTAAAPRTPRTPASTSAAQSTTTGGIPHMVLYLAVGAIVLLILFMVLKKRK